jgi:hypothetical protein
VAGGSNAEIINAPRSGFKYDASYFDALDFTTNLVQTLTFAVAGTTADQLKSLGFILGTTLKINMVIPGLTTDEMIDVNGGKGVQQKVSEFIFTIITVTPAPTSADKASVVFGTGAYPNGTGLLYPVSWIETYKENPPYLFSVELLPPATNLSVTYSYGDLWETAHNLYDSAIIVDLSGALQLNLMGLTKLTAGTAVAPTAYESTFSAVELGIMPIDPSGNLIIADVIKDQNSDYSSLYSNGLVRLPIQGRALVIESIRESVPGDNTEWIVQFSDMNVSRGKGWRGDLIRHAGGTYEGANEFVTPTDYQVLIFNAMAAGRVPAISTAYPLPDRVNPYNLTIPKVLSYKVDRLEIVLIQQTKTAPMSQGISVFKVEPQTIQYPQYQWSNQFQITEPNTYACMLLMPDYSNGRKLLSESRGVARWRNSLNNTQFCNRDTVAYSNESDYPSSLYNDQLVSFWANTPYNQRSLYGLREIAHSRKPVISVPMKIYSAFQGGQMLGNGGESFTLQVNLFGDSGSETTISTGSVFLFKMSISSWGGMYMGAPI